mmetsp:Transcript_5349/g.14760  ORF Transcript_5349/g.14760 Transcript_5349/m.14760 type:complete len:395 (-) Transcript_5349:157-1341(-)
MRMWPWATTPRRLVVVVVVRLGGAVERRVFLLVQMEIQHLLPRTLQLTQVVVAVLLVLLLPSWVAAGGGGEVDGRRAAARGKHQVEEPAQRLPARQHHQGHRPQHRHSQADAPHRDEWVTRSEIKQDVGAHVFPRVQVSEHTHHQVEERARGDRQVRHAPNSLPRGERQLAVGGQDVVLAHQRHDERREDVHEVSRRVRPQLEPSTARVHQHGLCAARSRPYDHRVDVPQHRNGLHEDSKCEEHDGDHRHNRHEPKGVHGPRVAEWRDGAARRYLDGQTDKVAGHLRPRRHENGHHGRDEVGHNDDIGHIDEPQHAHQHQDGEQPRTQAIAFLRHLLVRARPGTPSTCHEYVESEIVEEGRKDHRGGANHKTALLHRQRKRQHTATDDGCDEAP